MGTQVRQSSKGITSTPIPGKKPPKRPRYSEPILPVGKPAYVRDEGVAYVVKEMVAAGIPQVKIANLIINEQSGAPISIDTLQKYYGRELEIGLDEANHKVSRSIFGQAVGVPGIPNPNYMMPMMTPDGQPVMGPGNRPLVDDRPWLSDPIAPVPSMSMWWEKTRAGKKEGMTLEHTGANGQPLIERTVIVLPANGRDYDTQPILDLIQKANGVCVKGEE